MLRTRIILVVVSAIIIWLIFLLPKAVVENENQMPSDADSLTKASNTHGTIAPALSTTIRRLRAKFLASPQDEKSSIFADSLRGLYTQAGQFDSAAWFAESAASFLKNTESYLAAGNSYYEAYTFAVDPGKQKLMATKARGFLTKALEANPQNLEAKTKIAMTYLSTGTPMQGIAMLREVIAVDAGNELALFNLGMLSIQSGQYDRAVEWLTKLVAVNPAHLQGQLLLGVAYMNKGLNQEAREQFEKVKKMDADPSVQATADSYLKDLK